MNVFYTANPDIVIGPIPNYPGAVQINVRNPQILGDMGEMLRLPRGVLFGVMSILGVDNAVADSETEY